MTDAITGLLDLLRVQGMTCTLERRKATWGIKVVRDLHLWRFFLSVSGSNWVNLAGSGETIRLDPGDIAIIPANDDAETGSAKPVPLVEEHGQGLADAAGGLVTPARDQQNACLVCATFQIPKSTPVSMLAHLPKVLTARHNDALDTTTFDRVVDLTIEEMSQSEPPSQVTMNRLTEMLCIHTMRRWFESELSNYPSLQALTDPRMKLVLDEIQKDPSQPWTVETLAELYGQSRTAFSTHFKVAVGASPVTYLRQRRIQLSCVMLEDGSAPLDVVAFKSGYSDTNAFCRAFKRETGYTPGRYRQKRQTLLQHSPP